MNRKFPESRLRRLRSNPSLLKITAETTLTVDDLIQPIFIKEGIKKSEAIESMPNVNRHSKEDVIDYCKSLMDLGIKAVALFPVIDSKKKDLNNFEYMVTEIINEKVIDLGGSISAEHGIGVIKKISFLKYTNNINIEIMKKIKKLLDPNNIMNPNKIFDA